MNAAKREQRQAMFSLQAAKWRHAALFPKPRVINRETKRRANITYHLWRAFRIRPARWFEMYEAQAGRCANPGCRASLPSLFERKRDEVHVDHCHTTGRVRRLLCGRCNKAWGFLKENPRRARGLAAMAEF